MRLARLNRNAHLVMDSDLHSAGAGLNQTKQRLKADFEDNSRTVWVTQGRTIENYLTEGLLNEAIAAVHPKTKSTLVWDQFRDLTKLDSGKIIDKVAIARWIAQQAADFSLLDLEETITGAVASIRRHNS
jgi:hypothetical protein